MIIRNLHYLLIILVITAEIGCELQIFVVQVHGIKDSA